MGLKLAKMEIEYFRSFHDVQFDVGRKITAISGQNGVGKSNIASLIASGSGLSKKGELGSNFQPEFSDFFNVESTEDFTEYKLFLTYKEDGKEGTVLKRLSFKDDTATNRGIRIIPRTSNRDMTGIGSKEAERMAKDTFGVGGAARVPIPTIYLSISRLYPLGERRETVTIKEIKKTNRLLDFFSGSATTAHSAMQLCNERNIHIKFILVQLPEDLDRSIAKASGKTKAQLQVAIDVLDSMHKPHNICEIGKERIRRAGRKIKEEAGFTATADLDIGFRCLRLDESNMQQVYYTPDAVTQQDLFSMVDNVKPDRTPEDLLFQVMLDLGVLLSSPIEVKEIDGKKVFNVADGFLLACFDHDVTDETVKAIAQMKPYYAVFRDSSMASDSVATNFDQIFETYSPDTVRKVL